MKIKLFLLLFIFTQSIFADRLNVINSIKEIPKNKNVVLIFSMKFCPYCIRQEQTILSKVQPKQQEISFLKVMKDTKAFQELIQTGNFGEVEYFPTTYILTKDDDDSLDVKYPFTGFQRAESLLNILNDKEIMESF